MVDWVLFCVPFFKSRYFSFGTFPRTFGMHSDKERKRSVWQFMAKIGKHNSWRCVKIWRPYFMQFDVEIWDCDSIILVRQSSWCVRCRFIKLLRIWWDWWQKPQDNVGSLRKDINLEMGWLEVLIWGWLIVLSWFC